MKFGNFLLMIFFLAFFLYVWVILGDTLESIPYLGLALFFEILTVHSDIISIRVKCEDSGDK